MLDKVPYLVRSSEPNKLDTADFGTLCKVSNSSSEINYYIQMSSNSETPRWERLNALQESEAIIEALEITKK